MTDSDRSKPHDGLDRRAILEAIGATAFATSLAGCNFEVDEGPGDETSGFGPDPTFLSDDVNGALGSDVNRENQQLYFVETGTNALVRFDLIPEVRSTVSDGTETITQGSSFDFDSASKAGNRTDVTWNAGGNRQLEPDTDARVVFLGNVSYSDVSAQDLPTLKYSTDAIPEDPDETDLTEDTVFAVETDDGNYAKAMVTSYGDDLEVEYETFDVEDQRTDLGTGYNTPEDVVLAGDGETAYVTESGAGGALLEVTLSNADRSSATVLAGDLGPAHQLALDRASDLAYVVTDQRIVRVDLDGGTRATVTSDVTWGVGIVVNDDGSSAYVSERAIESGTPEPDAGDALGRVRRVDLGNGQTEVVNDNLIEPHHLAWSDPVRDELIVVTRAPLDTIFELDVVSESTSTLAAEIAENPASVSMRSIDEGVICSENAIRQFDLTSDLYEEAGPLFTGIGHVPVSSIDQEPDVPKAEAGYANTPSDYPLTVTDAPFGGSLDLMIDHYQAREAEGASHYRVMVDGEVRAGSWTALEWDDSDRRYDATEQTADGDGFFSLRSNASKWFRPRLGYALRTGSLSDGLHDLTVAFYSSASDSDEVSETSVQIRVDNEGPTARLGRIIHKLSAGEEVVDACAIVDREENKFRFEVTATDPQDHLRAWKLDALWGNNGHDVVQSENYGNQGSATDWTGPRNELVSGPDSWWSAEEEECAHTFRLRAWTRTINGYHYIQGSGYHKSLTLMLP